MLRWGCEGHGSAWVLRQARHLLREEFATVAHTPVLHQLDKADLADALASDFLQASELEVLQAVLKWGEHQLVRRMEDRGLCPPQFKKKNLPWRNLKHILFSF